MQNPERVVEMIEQQRYSRSVWEASVKDAEQKVAELTKLRVRPEGCCGRGVDL